MHSTQTFIIVDLCTYLNCVKALITYVRTSLNLTNSQRFIKFFLTNFSLLMFLQRILQLILHSFAHPRFQGGLIHQSLKFSAMLYSIIDQYATKIHIAPSYGTYVCYIYVHPHT